MFARQEDGLFLISNPDWGFLFVKNKFYLIIKN